MKYRNVIVSATEDCAENAGGYYCEVETLDGAKIDDFCIHPEELAQNPDVDFWINKVIKPAYPGYVSDGIVPSFPELRPASQDEVGLFYSQLPERDAELGTIGHVRIDFGRNGTEFHTTWWPRGPEELNSPEFKAELTEVVDAMRENVLKDMRGMADYCRKHGLPSLNGQNNEHGLVAETDRYRYCLRCILRQGDYNAYLTCYDKQGQTMAQVVGRLTFANGEVVEFTDPDKYIATFKEELGYRAATGMRHETLTNDPQVRKAIDDAIYDLYGEENPQPLSDYHPPVSEGPTLTMGGM